MTNSTGVPSQASAAAAEAKPQPAIAVQTAEEAAALAEAKAAAQARAAQAKAKPKPTAAKAPAKPGAPSQPAVAQKPAAVAQKPAAVAQKPASVAQKPATAAKRVAPKVTAKATPPAQQTATDKDSNLDRMRAELHENKQDVSGLSRELAALRSEGTALERDAERLQGRIDALEGVGAPADTVGLAEVTERVKRTLEEAGNLALQIDHESIAGADQRESSARLLAEHLRTGAENRAAEVTGQANAAAEQLLDQARSEASELIDAAEADARIRKAQGEAYYEAELARMSDFEVASGSDMARRWAQSTADWQRRADALSEELGEAEARLRELIEDAERLRADAKLIADATLQAAQREAQKLIEEAEEQAVKARRNAERLLMSVAARRDGIVSRFGRVRSLLRDVAPPPEQDPD